MSNTDSFVDEVNEELRRDQLFGAMRRYGWIAVLAVLALVGGAAWTEWSRAKDRAAAQAAGDAVYAALEADDSAARAAALNGLGAGGPVPALLEASALLEAGDPEAARAVLTPLAEDADLLARYSDLAGLKLAMIEGADPAQTRTLLERLATPGRPYRLLALEQLALLDLAGGDTDAALTGARAILEDAELTPGLRDRMETLMVSLGTPPGAVSE